MDEAYLNAVCPDVPPVALDPTSHLLRMPTRREDLLPFMQAIGLTRTRMFRFDEYERHFDAWSIEMIQHAHPEIRMRNIVVRAMIRRSNARQQQHEPPSSSSNRHGKHASTDTQTLAPHATMPTARGGGVRVGEQDARDSIATSVFDANGHDRGEEEEEEEAEHATATPHVRAAKHHFTSVAKVRHLLYPRGALTKMRKFAAVEVPLSAPMCNALSIQASGHIECKGGSTLLATYLAIELLLEWLDIDTTDPDVYIVDEGIKNIVSTCVMPFPMSIDKMCRAYPGQCRKPRDRSFPGCKYTIQLDRDDQCCIRFFEGKPNCICVGTRTVEDTRRAHAKFYRIACAAHGISPVDAMDIT